MEVVSGGGTTGEAAEREGDGFGFPQSDLRQISRTDQEDQNNGVETATARIRRTPRTIGSDYRLCCLHALVVAACGSSSKGTSSVAAAEARV